ncbi:hypothetical protein MKX03_002491 [Papaver bracteatum]|nr:hypothetical protein MKX03_002491 [Papaver bracteatum]
MEENSMESGREENVGDHSLKESDEIDPPVVGMIFDEYEDMYKFYKDYAKKVGFPVQKRSKRTNVEGNIRSVTFACSKRGKHESQAQTHAKKRRLSKVGVRLISQEESA